MYFFILFSLFAGTTGGVNTSLVVTVARPPPPMQPCCAAATVPFLPCSERSDRSASSPLPLGSCLAAPVGRRNPRPCPHSTTTRHSSRTAPWRSAPRTCCCRKQRHSPDSAVKVRAVAAPRGSAARKARNFLRRQVTHWFLWRREYIDFFFSHQDVLRLATSNCAPQASHVSPDAR